MSDAVAQAFAAVFGGLVRQAPGSAASTLRALDLVRPSLPAGLAAWRPLLVPGGFVTMSELAWLAPDRPAAAEAFCTREHPAMQDLPGLEAIAAAGHALEASFVLPPEDRRESHCLPLAARCDSLEPTGEPALTEVIATTRTEIDLCRDHGDSYGCVMLVLRPA